MADDLKVSETVKALEEVALKEESGPEDEKSKNLAAEDGTAKVTEIVPNVADSAAESVKSAEGTVATSPKANEAETTPPEAVGKSETLVEASSGANGEGCGRESNDASKKRKFTLKGRFKGIKNSLLALFSGPAKQEKAKKDGEPSEPEKKPQDQVPDVKLPKSETADPKTPEKNVDVSVAQGPDAIEAAEASVQKEAPAVRAEPLAKKESKESEEDAKAGKTVPDLHPGPDATPTPTPTAVPSDAADLQRDIDTLLEDAADQHQDQEAEMTTSEERKKRLSGESFDKLEDDAPQPEETKADDSKESSTEDFIKVQPNQES